MSAGAIMTTEKPPLFTRVATDDAVRYTIGPDLVMSNRQDLKASIVDDLAAGARRFVLDFTRCAYVDSSGLGVLVSIAKRIAERGGNLVLAGLNTDLYVLMQLTKLDTLFEICRAPDPAPYPVRPHTPGTAPVRRDALDEAVDDALRGDA